MMVTMMSRVPALDRVDQGGDRRGILIADRDTEMLRVGLYFGRSASTHGDDEDRGREGGGNAVFGHDRVFGQINVRP